MSISSKRLIIGISGASGVAHGVRLLELLRPTDIETHLVMSKAAEMTLAYETDYTAAQVRALADVRTVGDIVIRGPNQEPNIEIKFAAGPNREGMAARLFADLEPGLKEWALDRATLHPKGASAADLDKFWAQSWPATVIYCTGSLNPSETHQRATADKLRAHWHVMDAGHYPMLSHGAEMARLLLQEIER